jgi:PqqD family protein of HPr-rel-A system
MARAAMTATECFRLPPDVDFHRWQGGDEWVIYHSGTGETLRLSDAALAVLDLLAESDPLEQAAIEQRLNTMMDVPLSEQELHAAVNGLLRILHNHECIERVPCV